MPLALSMWEKKLPDLLIYCKYNVLSSITTNETFKINKEPLNYNSKKFVYLLEYKKCKKLYVGEAQTKFCMRLNNF